MNDEYECGMIWDVRGMKKNFRIGRFAHFKRLRARRVRKIDFPCFAGTLARSSDFLHFSFPVHFRASSLHSRQQSGSIRGRNLPRSSHQLRRSGWNDHSHRSRLTRRKKYGFFLRMNVNVYLITLSLETLLIIHVHVQWMSCSRITYVVPGLIVNIDL